jgi:hypothetical protein
VLVLFDHGTPKALALVLSEHTVHTAQSNGWDRLDNGALLNAAEEAGFDLPANNRPADTLPAESESASHRSRRSDGQHQVVGRSSTRRSHCCGS